MKQMKPIQYYSIGYNILRFYTKLYLRNFYKITTIAGLENVPKNKPVIFALNHQNALMDALNVLAAIKQQPVFMARADIFKKKKTADFLRWIKILPIYRIRDGVKNLQNNDAIFKEAIGVLKDKKILAILPEGTHGDQRRLRVLKKGIARIAFKAEEQNNFNLNIQIIPVGLDYSQYINTGGNLLINFGKAFDLQKYKSIYLENEQKAMSLFMSDLRKKMLVQMLHIEDKENYDEIYTISNLYLQRTKQKKLNHIDELKTKQRIADEIEKTKQNDNKTFLKITQQAKDIKLLIEKLNIRNWVLKQEKYNSIKLLANVCLLLILLPLFLFGFVTNIIPFRLPVLLSKKVKDPQFLSSFRFVLALLIFTVFYLIYLVILLFVTNKIWFALLIFIAIPLMGIFSFRYFVYLKKTMVKFKINKLQRKKNSDYTELRKLWNEINKYFDNLHS